MAELKLDRIVRYIDGQLCISTAALLEVFRISAPALTTWARQGCPKAARGWWPLADVIAWRGAGNRRDAESELSPDSPSAKKLYYDAEYKRLQAEMMDFKNAIARGEYVLKDEVADDLQKLLMVLKRSMLGYSRKIATEVAAYVDPMTARRIESMITELTHDALEQLSQDGSYKAPRTKKARMARLDNSISEGASAAGAADGLGVGGSASSTDSGHIC